MSLARRLWLLALIPLVLMLGEQPVQRTQEARVVETARQMLGHGPGAWLIPSLNGQIRLRKPPLAYWLAGGSFEFLGVTEQAARLPTVLLSWLTLAATYTIATRLLGATTGLLSAACLLSSYLFFREGRLAETDGPAAFFVTLAVYYFLLAADKPSPRFFHLAAAASGLAFFAKGGPGFFPLLFFFVLAVVERKPKLLLRFVLCGAPLTLLAIAGWWYGYAALTRGWAQFHSELAEVTEGIDHPAWFYVYGPMLLLSTAPWSILTIAALIAAGQNAKSNRPLRIILIWAAVTFVPLCFIGNKQEHYLLPVMPPLMILTAWLISQASQSPAVRNLIGITIIASIAAPLSLPIVRYCLYKNVLPLDILLAIGIAGASVLSWRHLKRNRFVAAAATLAATWALGLSLLLGLWASTINPANIRTTAAEIRRLSDGPYVFYGGDTSLPLCFALRREIPRLDDNRPNLLLELAEKNPTLCAIWQLPQHQPPPHLPPPPFHPIGPDLGAKGQAFRLFTKE